MYVQWWSYTSMWVYPSAADRDTQLRSQDTTTPQAIFRTVATVCYITGF
jgi:hypothetical protein